MREVFEHPESIPKWQAAADGKPVDWDALFHGYNSTVDWPGCSFWHELAEHFPEAKVVLTVRDPERWYESVSNTIYASHLTGGSNPEHWNMLNKLVFENTFHGRFEDRAYAIEMYERHNQEVQRNLPLAGCLCMKSQKVGSHYVASFSYQYPKSHFPVRTVLRSGRLATLRAVLLQAKRIKLAVCQNLRVTNAALCCA